jgi:hypothetical protein
VNLSRFYNLFKPTPPIPVAWTVESGTDIADPISVLTELEQCSSRHGVDLYMAELAVFAARDSKNPTLEVHILPAEPVLLVSAHSGM